MTDNRIAYWDNLKSVLIFLVVFVHIILPVSEKGPMSYTTFYWVCLFDMSAFVFSSGFFAKSYVHKNKKGSSRKAWE